AFQLGIYNEYAGDPAYIKHDIENILAVTKDDIKRVYEQYIKDKSAIITSFVPKHQAELAVKGSMRAQVVEEKIIQGEEQEFAEDLNPEFVKTFSIHDRSEPPLSDLPAFKTPEIWRTESSQGIPVIGIEQHELPLVDFSLRIEGGQLLDQQDKLGTAELLSAMMNEGTKFKSPVQLQDAVGQLGSSLSVIATKTSITINGKSLKRNYLSTMELLTEMVLHPRFLRKDFKIAKAQQLARIKSSYGSPSAVAGNIIMRKIYGDDHVAGVPLEGYESTVKNIKLKDVINWYKNNFSLKLSSFQVVGDISQEQVLQSLVKLDSQWGAWDVELPKFESTKSPSSPKIYFVDFPDAKQSVLYVGKATIKGDHRDYNKLNIVNNRLGTGSSARLTQTLRIDKGYTYGAFSFVERASYDGAFIAGSQVRSNVTLESLEIIRGLISNYSASYEQQDIDVTKNLITKGNARKFETLSQLMDVTKTMELFNLPDNYLDLAQQELKSMTLQQSKTMIDKHLNEQQMIYVIVGDAKTQYERIKQLGYGEPVMLDRMGNSIISVSPPEL
ncbi:MAG: insulinase family protein, partial [Proteobacteria bacterium]|nr:insulinase family protein [Pseudomonadota bacterium]